MLIRTFIFKELTDRAYNQFYHDYSILREENESVKAFRILLTRNVSKVIKTAMNILGIDVPERM